MARNIFKLTMWMGAVGLIQGLQEVVELLEIMMAFASFLAFTVMVEGRS